MVYYSGNDLSYDDKTWRAQYLDADNSVSAKKNVFEGCRIVPGFPVDGHIYRYTLKVSTTKAFLNFYCGLGISGHVCAHFKLYQKLVVAD